MKLGSKTLVYSFMEEVGILFDVTSAKSLGSWCPISDRIVVAKLVARPLNLRTIQGYAPTSDNKDEEVEQFYEELVKAKGCLKSQDIIIFMGDFNAKVGDKRVENGVGPSGIGIVYESGKKAWQKADPMSTAVGCRVVRLSLGEEDAEHALLRHRRRTSTRTSENCVPANVSVIKILRCYDDNIKCVYSQAVTSESASRVCHHPLVSSLLGALFAHLGLERSVQCF
ncbi:craniofacial development protein 2 [Plakobranchus ocellatus]|uniref:Craniofacial development protein 2 n=1 Tax=Plakobranchus ocellatus TaxID=259542 RepID=A0AAV4A9H5_9GAST|nr:craniofacial development protein 2 [Plakobranchus ocellatus]